MKVDWPRLRSLAVLLHGRRAGVLNRLAGDQQLFAFDPEYADDAARPTLSLSFKGRSGALITAARPVMRRLPPFFSNLLPEGRLRSYLAERAGVNPENEFFVLAALGADLPGALTVEPLDATGVEFDEPVVAPTAAPAADQGHLRFSLAGVQLKFSAVTHPAGGLTIPARGVGGAWIVKLPSTQYEAVAENEFLMLELARRVGITVPRTWLIAVSNVAGLPPEAARLAGHALAVERFDRTPERVHMEDFAQVYGLYPEAKYQRVSYANIARVLAAETGQAGTDEFVRRLVYSVLIGNGDMHLKNWSLLYPDTRTAVLSPAYDFASTVAYIPDDRLALTFGGSRALDGVTAEQLRRFTDKAALALTPVIRIARETAEATRSAWRQLPGKEQLPAPLAVAIDTQIERAARNTLEQLAAPSA
jgi:serine/threonine-protein kinase HipA